MAIRVIRRKKVQPELDSKIQAKSADLDTVTDSQHSDLTEDCFGQAEHPQRTVEDATAAIDRDPVLAALSSLASSRRKKKGWANDIY